MSVTFKNLARFSVLALAASLTVGCATNSALKEVREEARRAQATADNAAATANRALDVANSAQTCCDNNSEKIDRMFKRSMMK